MPLVSDRKSKPLLHSNSRAIGFWMSVEGRTPIQPVRVLVSYHAPIGARSDERPGFAWRSGEFRSVQIASRERRKPQI